MAFIRNEGDRLYAEEQARYEADKRANRNIGLCVAGLLIGF